MPEIISASARLTSWLVRRSRRSASGPASSRCTLRASASLAGAGQLDDPGHDRDEAVVIAAHPRQQLDLVAGDVLQPVQVIAELGELPQRGLQHLLRPGPKARR